tara:strand:- start:11 stop:343 length:333 start_codon:yes stop_codon:yes gene_type:complete
MIKHLKKIDRTIAQTFDYLGVPRLDQMDRSLARKGKELKSWKLKDVRNVEITMLLSFAMVAVTLGSVASLYAIGVPEVAKNGLRLTALLGGAGLAGMALHIGLKKLSGGR